MASDTPLPKPVYFDTTDKFLFPIRFFSVDDRQLSVGVNVLKRSEGRKGPTLDFDSVGHYIGYGFWQYPDRPGYEKQPPAYNIHFAWEILKWGKGNFLYMARAYTNDYFTFFYKMPIPQNPEKKAKEMGEESSKRWRERDDAKRRAQYAMKPYIPKEETEEEKHGLLVQLQTKVQGEIVNFALKRSRGRTIILGVFAEWSVRLHKKTYIFKVYEENPKEVEQGELKELASQKTPERYMGRWRRKFYFLDEAPVTYGPQGRPLPPAFDYFSERQKVTQFRFLKGKIVTKVLELDVPDNLKLEEFIFEKERITKARLREQLLDSRYAPDVENGWLFFYQRNSMYSLTLRKFFEISKGGVNVRRFRNMLSVAALDPQTLVVGDGIYELRGEELVRVQDLREPDFNYKIIRGCHTLFRGSSLGFELYGKVRDRFDLLADTYERLSAGIPIPTLEDDKDGLVKFLKDNVPSVARELLGIVVDFCKWY